jgi:hypothetical protein
MAVKREQGFGKIAVTLGLMLFIVNSVVFIFLGQVNADEGWYLYASKLVYTGQHPYQDFAFTQTPLLPYIYGIAQNLFAQSLYLGRITSVIFSAAAFTFSLSIARNYGGSIAAGLTALLWGTFTYGIYFQSITKTQALVTFFFTLAIYVLSANLKQNLKAILLTIVVVLAALTRLSALFFALPFLIYALSTANIKTKGAIIAIGFLALFWVLTLALPDTAAAEWGLLTHHVSQWGDIPLVERIGQILGLRTLQFLVAFPLYTLLWLTLFLMAYKRIYATRRPSEGAAGPRKFQIMPVASIKTHAQRYFVILIATTALLLFAVPNWISGRFYQEYFVPLIFVSLPIISIAYTRLIPHQGQYAKAFMNLALLTTVVSGVTYGGFYFIDISGGNAPIKEIRRVSTIIVENSTPSDELFVLEGLSLAIESQRSVMPNMTMAQFSFYDTDTETANQLHLVNAQIILSTIEDGRPKIVILTDLDWLLLQDTAYYEEIGVALAEKYRLIHSAEKFGQHSNHVDVYMRREGP